MNKKLENAIIIGGKVYELVDDSEGDECERCALTQCEGVHEPICCILFDEAERKRFTERRYENEL